MRKLQTQEDKEKKNKILKILLGVFLAGIMIFSTVGYALVFGGGIFNEVEEQQIQIPDQGEGPVFNGQFWIYNVGGYQFAFTYTLEMIGDIPISSNKTIADYSDSPTYIVTQDQNAINEISQNIARFTPRFQQACLGECEENLPEKDCSENLIIYEPADENRIYQEGNCIFIEGNLSAVDAFLYSIIGLK